MACVQAVTADCAGLAAYRSDVLRLKAGVVSAFLKILANPDRLLLVYALTEREWAVGELENTLGMRQPVLSQQLAELRAAGVVASRRQGKSVFYRLADDSVSAVMEALRDVFRRHGVPQAPVPGEQ